MKDKKTEQNTAEINIEDFKNYESIWRNGRDLDGKKVKIEDALSVPSASLLFPKVVSNIVKEAAEPLMVGTSLLQRINFSFGQTITFGAVGVLEAGDIAEGQEYPEKSLTMGGSTVTATIGKCGLAVRVTEEMIRYSQFDIIGMHLRAAGKALARLKERKIFNMIRSSGVTIFDNVNPGASLKGVCTGRDLSGAQNGSFTMDDLFDAFGHIMLQGFMANTLIMHPLMWVMFVKDPVLRAFALANGGGTFFANWTGNPNGQAPWANSSQGGLGVSPGQSIVAGPSGSSTAGTPNGTRATGVLGFPQDINSAPVIPSYFNLPMRIVVSPLVFFDPHSKLSDIYMCDSSELGVIVVDEDVSTDEFDDPRVDIKKIKIRERYGLQVLNEGHGIGVIKNVHVVPNEVVLPAQTTLDVSGSSLAAIDPNANVLG